MAVVIPVANAHCVLCKIMFMKQEKESLKQRLVGSLKMEREVCRIVVFGSFVNSDDPHDMDILPLKAGVQGEIFMDEIEGGEVIYERNTCGYNS